jgi:hypothetical protein
LEDLDIDDRIISIYTFSMLDGGDIDRIDLADGRDRWLVFGGEA